MRKNPTKSAGEVSIERRVNQMGVADGNDAKQKFVRESTKHEGRRESVLFGRHGGISARYRGWLHLVFLASIAPPTFSV